MWVKNDCDSIFQQSVPATFGGKESMRDPAVQLADPEVELRSPIGNGPPAWTRAEGERTA